MTRDAEEARVRLRYRNALAKLKEDGCISNELNFGSQVAQIYRVNSTYPSEIYLNL